MPVFRSGVGEAPDWCELMFFEIVEVGEGTSGVLEGDWPKEKLIVARGKALIRAGGELAEAEEGADLDIVRPGEGFAIERAATDCVLVRMCGDWGEETGGSGLFRGESSAQPTDSGDEVTYEKRTCFDSHYHDCDEYWIIVEGRGLAVSEGKAYEVGPGDCVATGMGHHHDLPQVHEPILAVYFETTLEGNKRRGHLWNHTHCIAQPTPGRD